ncbi:hypothetical protein BJY52DRAFT_921442 [Lactarius psammicola]|nr:hypothetical protein BJY52DRAFT_921442 [Lactarius psammicola]
MWCRGLTHAKARRPISRHLSNLFIFEVVRVVPPLSLVANVRPINTSRSLPTLLFAWRLRTHAPQAPISVFFFSFPLSWAWVFPSLCRWVVHGTFSQARTLSVPSSRAPNGRHDSSGKLRRASNGTPQHSGSGTSLLMYKEGSIDRVTSHRRRPASKAWSADAGRRL